MSGSVSPNGIVRAPPSDLNWIGGTDNAASDPNDWSPGVAPRAGDTLTMSSGTINITDDDLAGNPLTLVSPDSTHPFNDDINLANGTARLTDGGDDFTLTTSDSVATDFIGGNGVGFNGVMSLSPNGTTTLAGMVRFLYGVFVNNGGNNGSNLVNDGAIGLTNASINANLSGNGTFDLTRYHDGPGMVEINGSVAAGLTFTMDGASEFQSVLTLDQPTAFAAQINVPANSPEGSPGSDTIHLQGLTATSYTFQDGTLTLFNGTNTVDTLSLTTALPLTVDQDSNGVGLYFNQTDPNGTQIPQQGSSGLPNPPFPPPATPPNFDIVDMTTGQAGTSAGEAYSGPVPGLTNDIIIATSDNINVTAAIPNTFIKTGTGTDAIDVSKVNGNNVLDGSTGSNFLTGGAGNDTFFVDDRDASGAIFSTVAGFHAGDNATIWTPPEFQATTLTQQDFEVPQTTTTSGLQLVTSDNQGAAGFTGLTIGVVSPDGQTANLTLSGYSTADLTNGRLSISFGHTADMSGLPGSDYMQIHANG